jgi:hypothetical protein
MESDNCSTGNIFYWGGTDKHGDRVKYFGLVKVKVCLYRLITNPEGSRSFRLPDRHKKVVR